MKTSFKTLSFIFFIPFMLLIFPLHSQAEEEVSTQTKDIQVFEGEEIINVSKEEIKERIFNGEPVHFAEEHERQRRTIESALIIEAIKNGVDKIDIKKAIINGNLDFHIKENLVGIEESGIEADEINKLKSFDIKKVYLVSPSITISSCQLQGNLKAGYDHNLKSIVIFKKSVAFRNSTIVYKADFWAASFNEMVDFRDASFNGKANFRNASFNGKADFGADFNGEAYFEDASFNGEAYFRAASFNGEAYFGDTSFNGEANFRAAIFKEMAYFGDASFNGEADFGDARFNGEAYFKDARFNGEAYFGIASFNERANFGDASFNERANFFYTSFNGKADFGADFNGEAYFEAASFNGEAYFRAASFKEMAYFRDASFNGKADFGGVNFKDVIVFSGCTFLSDINLQDANYQVLRISWEQLEGHLDGTISGIFNLPEDIKKAIEGEKNVDTHLEGQMRDILNTENIILWEQAYLRLIKNFEDLGDKKSADDAYYHYRYNKPKYKTQHLSERSEDIGEMPIKLALPEHLKSKIYYKNEQLIFKGVMSEEERKELLGLQEELPDSYKIAVKNLYKRSQSSLEYISGISPFEKWVEHNLFGRTCGYGVRPFNALGVGLVLISSFTMFYFIGCLVFPSKNYLIYQRREEDFSTKSIHYKLYNCFYFSVTTFTTVGYGDLQPRGGFKVAAMIEGFLGWMTMALFLVTLGNVWLR